MKWKIAPRKSEDLIEQLLLNRGIKTEQEKENFLNPKIINFEKDLQIPGIEKAQDRIALAIRNNELIIIYGDYDVDGISACAILYKGLTSLGAKVLPYIPHREKEGYGLSIAGLQSAKKSGAGLVITVDNGIVAFEQAKFAKELDLDLIITDHHLKQDDLPTAFAIVHSTKMCGAAVAWCLIKGLIKKDLKDELLQFVALATVCDLIPLVNLGRAFVVEGLQVLNTTSNLGLQALIKESGITANIGSYEIGHIIGPRLNAIGRLGHAIEALRLLCTKDSTKAKILAKLLCETNITRQQMTSVAIEQARLLVDNKKKVQVLSSKEWSAGIIGLIAGRVTDEYYCPTIAIATGEVISKGSARSIDGINIVELIRKHSDILIDIGGHPGAAGFSILREHIEVFKKRLEGDAVNLPESIERVLEIDVEVSSKQLSKTLITKLQVFEPFGMSNKKPVFVTKNMSVSDIRTVGEGKHLKLKADGLDVIAFGMGNLSTSLQSGQLISLAYSPELDSYSGIEKLQLKVKDIKLEE